MTTKILELTEKIYKEGVEKANDEAEKILEKAKNQASEIINLAQKKEQEIIQEAKKQAIEIKNISESEMQLSAKQAVSNLKQQITELVTAAQIEKPVKNSFKDDEFVKKIILSLFKNWNPQKPEEFNINLLLSEKDEKDFSAFLKNKADELLKSELEINFDANIKSGFKIGPKNGNYIISFTDKDFENYFKKYIKNSTKQLLFD